MKRNPFIRSIASVLTAAMLLSMTPDLLSARAEEPPEPPQETVYADYEKPPVEQYILSEDVSRRTENEKHFLLSDGSYQLSSYQDNVHYKDEEGNWQEIDNSLEYKPVGGQENIEEYDFYQNKANDFSVKFSKKYDSPKHVKVEKDGYEISWKYLREEPEKSFWRFLSTAQSPPDVQIENAAKTMTRAAAAGDDAFLERSEVFSKATYADVEQYTDLEYKVLPTGVKENIRVEQIQDDYTYEFELQADGLTYQPTEDGGYIFVNEAGETIFTMPAPYMVDANNEMSESVVLQFSKTENGYLFKVIADPEWINAEERAFPVVIDPMIHTSQNKEAVKGTFVAQNKPDTNMRKEKFIGVGYDGNMYNQMRSFLKIQLPTLQQSDMVVKSTLNLAQGEAYFQSGVADNKQINLFRPNKDWNLDTIKWSNAPAIESSVRVDSQFIKKAASDWDWITFDITKVVKGWYQKDFPNYGVMICQEDVTHAGGFFHNDLSDYKENYPVLTVQYVNNKGLEDYWSYHSQSLPAAGTAYINDYTGNLVYTQGLVSTSGIRAPIGMDLVYNSYMLNKQPPLNDVKVGAGFMLDINTRIRSVTDSALRNNGYHYEWIDMDGTERYFKKDGDKYVDETGSGYTYRLNYDNNPDLSVIEDKDKNKIIFTRGRFYQRIDANGNRTKLVYKDSYPYQYFDGVDRQINFTVDSDGYLQKITDHLGRVTKLYYMETSLPSIWKMKRLVAVYYPDGTSTHFNYARFLLGGLTDIFSKEGEAGSSTELGRLTYTYDDTDTYRVTSVTEAVGSTVGQTMKIKYGNDNSTTFETSGKDDDINTTADNMTVTYVFDNTGRVTSVYDRKGNAQSYNYYNKTRDLTANPTTAELNKSNKIIKEGVTGSYVHNLIKNPSAEESIRDWSVVNWTGDQNYIAKQWSGSQYVYIGHDALQIDVNSTNAKVSYAQPVTLEANTPYTLSAYAKLYAMPKGSKGAFICMEMVRTNGEKEMVYEYLDGPRDDSIDNGYRRMILNFRTPTDLKSAKVHLGSAYVNNSSVFFDAMQLERGTVANSFNLVENGDFTRVTSNRPDKWYAGNLDSNDTVDAGRMYMRGKTGGRKYIKQQVLVYQPASNTFMLSAKAKGNSLPAFGDRRFRIEVGINYQETTATEWQSADFNMEAGDWQSAALPIVPKQSNYTINSIDVYIEYYYNENTVFFDDVQLLMEPAQSYIYDDKGNPVSVKANAEQKSSFEWGSNNQLSKQTDPKGYSYTYSYDSKNNLTKSVSQNGIITNYTYDAYGNRTKASSSGKSTADGRVIESTAEYTPDGNFQTKVYDNFGNGLSYQYDTGKGLLLSETDPEGRTVNYTYDPKTEEITGVSATVGGQEVKNEYAYKDGTLWQVNHNGFSYAFDYDIFGNRTKTSVGSATLAEYAYNNYNGKLSSMTYGNGDTARYVYDEYDRVIQVNYNEASNSQYRSTYGADGSVARTDDTLNRLSNYYTKDSTGRLLRMVVKDTGSTNNGYDASYEYGYDRNNNIIKRKATIGADSRTFQYNFMKDNLLGRADMPNGGYLTRSHDNFDRVTVKDINITSEITPRIRSAFTYYDVEGTNKTSFHIKTMQNSGVPGGSKYTYVYDKLGNITRITETKDGIDRTIDYTYDELSQLTREINEVTGQQVDYVYDLGGNIVSKTITDLATNESTVVPYTYDSAWKDKMVSFDGKAITYDAIGNPLTYDGDNYAWTQGRKLQSITGSGKNIRYSYTNDGMRLYKLVNGVRTNFYYDAGRLVGQQTGGVNTFFYYNGDDELVGLEHGGAVYYFTKNAQGDIVGIYDKQGVLQAQYVYDTWGKVVSVQDADGNAITDPNHIGHVNPIRYRGYYYDNETGYYYLQTRYYNSEWGRFLNADAIAGMIGVVNDHNVFAYCRNNPVNCVDPTGMYCRTPRMIMEMGPCTCSGCISSANEQMAWAQKMMAEGYPDGKPANNTTTSVKPSTSKPSGGQQKNPKPTNTSKPASSTSNSSNTLAPSNTSTHPTTNNTMSPGPSSQYPAYKGDMSQIPSLPINWREGWDTLKSCYTFVNKSANLAGCIVALPCPPVGAGLLIAGAASDFTVYLMDEIEKWWDN